MPGFWPVTYFPSTGHQALCLGLNSFSTKQGTPHSTWGPVPRVAGSVSRGGALLWSLSDTNLRGAQKYPSKEKEERQERKEGEGGFGARGGGGGSAGLKMHL